MATRRPAKIDIEIIQNARWIFPLRVKDQAGNLLSFTGWTAKAQVRADPDDAIALTITVALGLFGTSPNQYNVELLVSASTSAAASDWGDGRWDLRVVDTFGEPARIAEGQAVLSRRITA